MKKVIYVIFATLAIVYLSSVLIIDLVNNNTQEDSSIPQYTNDNNIDYNKQEVVINDYAITKALASKMIALIFYNYNELITMDIYIDYDDCNEDDWFYYYVNAMVANEWFEEGDESFLPYGLLTKEETKQIFEKLNDYGEPIDLNKFSLDSKEEITPEEFMNIYFEYLYNNEDKSKVSVDNLIIFATPTVTDQLKPWQMATDKGIYDYSGLKVDKYLEKEAKLLLNQDKVITVLGYDEISPVLTNAYITNRSDNIITVFMGGVSRDFEISMDSDIKEYQVADIIIENSKITSIIPKTNEHKGIIKRIDDDYIELEDGVYVITEGMKVYSNINGKIEWKAKKDLIVGTDIASYIKDDEGICAAIIVTKPQITNIRVALNTTDFKGLIHDSVSITCESEFVLNMFGIEKEYGPNDIITIGEQGYDIGDERVYIYPKDGVTKLQILNIERGYGETRQNPKYRGIIEIAKQGNGYSIVNELNIEEYLYAVVPSELPSSYGVEASKVQAITARSYAYNQMLTNRYHRYGAHVDDSVSCQVYNNIPENETSIKAVNETKGLGLTYGSNVISANFFSTSCGYTANSGEVWANGTTKQFPNTTPIYLSAIQQYKQGSYGDLSNEEDFYNFIKTDDVDAFDRYFPWFRWNVTMTKEEIEASINYNLQDLYESKPNMIRTLDENSIFRTQYIDGVGELIDIHVYKRGEGGNIMEIVIEGSERTVKVSTEYVIRMLIRPKQYLEGGRTINLNLSNGSVKENFNIMPSAFYSMEKVKDSQGNLIKINFYGGGYGHGVGMSQNGVKGMVDEGYNYKEILAHFYKDINIEPIF